MVIDHKPVYAVCMKFCL